MWIRPNRQMQARMPSMRPQRTSTPPTPGSVPDMQQRKGAPPPPQQQPPLSEEEEKRKRAGGFHESSYELKTGMDMLESDWPDDVTIPGALDDHPE